MKHQPNRFLPLQALATAACLALLAPQARALTTYGALSNFDVVNDTTQVAHGFEIDLEGIHASDIVYTFAGQRYGAPTVRDYTNGNLFGVTVTYAGHYASGSWDLGTPSGTVLPSALHCYNGWGALYNSGTPCDHFGVGLTGNASKTTYNWLVEGAVPGTLAGTRVSLPAVTWAVSTPAATPANPAPAPTVVAAVQAPAPEVEAQFGTAQWVKVFTTETETEVRLNELVGGNAIITAAQSHTEIEWQLLQTDPGNPLAGRLETGGALPVATSTRSVVRRYEFYQYTGESNAADNEAQPLFGDSHPNLDPTLGVVEVGNLIGVQNTALNLNATAAVPEPASALLLAGGLAFLWGRRPGQQGDIGQS